MAHPQLAGAKPVTTTNPIEAAKRIRLVLNTARQIVLGQKQGQIKPWQRALKELTRVQGEQSGWHVNHSTHSVQLRNQLFTIEEALKARRTQPGMDALTMARGNLEAMILAEQSIKNSMYTRLNRVRDRAEQEMYPPEPETSYDDDGNAIPQATGDLASLVVEAFNLAQCFPTVEDLPKTDAENTLRAIIALLRHHRWPGTENLTQVAGEEVKNGSDEGAEKSSTGLTEVLNELAGAAGPPEPVGKQPGSHPG